MTIQGAAARDRAGSSVSNAGDVNGDGIDDLIIGASHADPNGREYAGASYVVFGSDQGFPATIDLASDADLVIQGATAEDTSGSSFSGAGDVNGDGIDDLIIGAFYADPNGRETAGASYVIFGSDQGFPATIDLATDADVVIQGAADHDRSGWSVSGAGDVDGDGVDDLIIGAPVANVSYVVFGSDQGLPAVIDLANDADLIIEGAPYDDSGDSVSGAGDIDGDGIDDLIIGAPDASPNGRSGAGASYLVLGTDQGFPPIIDLATEADLVIQGAADFVYSGDSVSGAGDVNGDGIDDLVIGASHASPNGRSYAGASYVVFGSDQGFPATIDLASDGDLVIQGASASLYVGLAVSGAGDIDGDGIDDLIIGTRHASSIGREYAGASYVVLGAMNLAGTVDLADPVRGADLIIHGAATYDASGTSVSGAGDVNGDGIADLLIGAPGAESGAGASYVVFGGPAAAIERLIARVEAADLPRRLERNLTRKLSKALDDVTEDEITRALFRLRVLVDKVKRRRGKDIDEADADVWVANAKAIIDTLRAQRRSPASGHRALSASLPAR